VRRRVLLGLQLDGKTGRAFHAPVEPTTDELEVITRRQALRVLEQAHPDDPPRRLSGAGLVVIGCIVAGTALYVLGFVAALVWSR
jgi:hypothetical protein